MDVALGILVDRRGHKPSRCTESSESKRCERSSNARGCDKPSERFRGGEQHSLALVLTGRCPLALLLLLALLLSWPCPGLSDVVRTATTSYQSTLFSLAGEPWVKKLPFLCPQIRAFSRCCCCSWRSSWLAPILASLIQCLPSLLSLEPYGRILASLGL